MGRQVGYYEAMGVYSPANLALAMEFYLRRVCKEFAKQNLETDCFEVEREENKEPCRAIASQPKESPLENSLKHSTLNYIRIAYEFCDEGALLYKILYGSKELNKENMYFCAYILGSQKLIQSELADNLVKAIKTFGFASMEA